MSDDSATTEYTVAELLVDYLARAGVDRLFGVAGSTIMPILDVIADDDRIDYVGARYELSAAEMASGYARAGARLGVFMVHVGPGATGCVTALAAAARDGVPLLFITGNEESTTLAREPYHDWDLHAVMRPLTRFSYRINRPDELPHALRRALTEAGRGITGPVHLDLPEDIALERVPADVATSWLAEIEPVLDAFAKSPVVPVSRPAPNAAEVERAVDLLTEARAPAIVLGEAVQWTGAVENVAGRLAELGIPFATSFGARGGVGDPDGYVGTIGRFGSRDTTAFVRAADVLLTLGAEMTDIDTVRWSIPGESARVVAVHHDPGKIDRRVASTLGVVADVEEFVNAFAAAYERRGGVVGQDWLDRARAVDRTNGPVGNPAGEDVPPLDALLVSRVLGAAPDSWVVTADPGFAPLTLSAPVEFGGTRFVYAYGFGSMGFAVPSAIGATFLDRVDGGIAVIGDGALFMSLSSLESIASLGAPVVVLVLDDGGFGSQRKKQQEGYGRNFGVDYDNPDIAAIAAAMGIESVRIETADQVEALAASLPTRTTGVVAVVSRSRTQEGTWYEGSRRRR
jgi:acetolactate synthase I/II/III large subunit